MLEGTAPKSNTGGTVTDMSKAKTKDAIFSRPSDGIKPTDYLGDSMIDPMDIFGFPNLAAGEAPVIKDHPDFPNPRTGPMDRELIEEIKEAGTFVEPVAIYFHQENGEEVAVLVNGKTRLTAVAEAWAEDPNTDKFRVIPYVVVAGTPMEVQFLQAKLNLADSRRPLSDVETADFLIRMENEYGLTEDQQLAYLMKPNNQGTIRWLREAKMVAVDPVARPALEAGEIDKTTAKGVAKMTDEKAKKEAVEKVKEEKAKGKTEREARQAVGGTQKTSKGEQAAPIRTANRTTLGWKPALELLKEYYGYAKVAFQRNVDAEKINWTDKGQREDYIFDREVIANYTLCVKFLKLDHLSLRQQMVEIEGIFGKEECEALKLIAWLPEETSTKKTGAKAPAKPAAKKTTRTKAGAATKPAAKGKK